MDTGCVNSKGLDPDLNTLERWEGQGKLSLQRAEAMLSELAGERRIAKAKTLGRHPGLFSIGISRLGGGDVLAGPDLEEKLAQLLFPTAPKLTVRQLHDVEHLRQHVRTGSDVFITNNRSRGEPG